LRSAHALNQLVSDILDVSRIIAGKLVLNVAPTSLVGVVEAALDTVRPAARAKEITLVPALDGPPEGFSGDPDRLQQVVWNLLLNAVKFTPRGGRVQVRLSATNSHVEIVVVDDGPGISPDFLPHVFERFRQADSSTTRRQVGLGLGLAIVRHLVELHGGEVHAANRDGQPGAVFTVSLPRQGLRSDLPSALASPGLEPGAAWRQHAPRLDGVKVLVVDDEAEARELVAVTLQSCGARTIVAESAPEALRGLARERPDLIIADIAMPGEDGYELLSRVRSLPVEQGGSTPALALTAYAGPDDRLHVLRAGFQMHLAKPAHPAELIAAVASLVSPEGGPGEPQS
jgi:CheY-like chemotaxis protein/anti-sigma regulatory factor (Ser/Thr protein kinase)